MGFELGQRVYVPRHQAAGTIIHIDHDWEFPYEVEFDDEVTYRGEDLFLATELVFLADRVDGQPIDEYDQALVAYIDAYEKAGVHRYLSARKSDVGDNLPRWEEREKIAE